MKTEAQKNIDRMKKVNEIIVGFLHDETDVHRLRFKAANAFKSKIRKEIYALDLDEEAKFALFADKMEGAIC